MRKIAINLFLVALGLSVGLLLAEGIVRLTLPAIPGGEISFDEYVSLPQRSPGMPRLFPAGFNQEFDIRGLYQGADKVSFRVSPNRFIEPEPQGEAKYRVLFLGGSTTEGIFLNPQERWPTRLNVPSVVATYNAGMSETGMLGQYQTLKYLAEHGYRFDLVVLATNHNDSAWSRRFANVGGHYRLQDYNRGVEAVYRYDYDSVENRIYPLRLLAWFHHIKQTLRQKHAATTDSRQAPSLPVEYYLRMVRPSQNLPIAHLDDCKKASDPRADTLLAASDWQANFPLFKSEVKRLVGAELLVVSEPNSYGAPAESFFYADLRVPMACDTGNGPSVIAPDDTLKVMKDRVQAYLQAAKSAGVPTFDLATAMEPYSNGPKGGSYLYDSVHFSPLGTDKVAEFLRPVLASILEKSGTH